MKLLHNLYAFHPVHILGGILTVDKRIVQDKLSVAVLIINCAPNFLDLALNIGTGLSYFQRGRNIDAHLLGTHIFQFIVISISIKSWTIFLHAKTRESLTHKSGLWPKAKSNVSDPGILQQIFKRKLIQQHHN